MLNLLEGLVPPQTEESEEATTNTNISNGTTTNEAEEEAASCHMTPDHLKKVYVFSLIWGLGAFLSLGDRDLFNTFVRDKLTALDLPPATSSIFDYVVCKKGIIFSKQLFYSQKKIE